ncbi:sugar phosphate isomerase/epimerase family protein [Mahella sp.]|uniref:sugar phosphate isomerase/epimerase family protein n=1 Tax=Mahella sp. TaxID=2798721 RepID=UPI0025B9F8DC|nr:sugar phosphate isomerase/epimerase family protein [Mahella sp.]MBZ4666394.1 Xylose isomerase protein barrel [Mahella sp.]
MVRFGCCLPLASFAAQLKQGNDESSDIARQLELGLETLHRNGYDFAELGVGTVANLSDDDFERVKDVIAAADTKVYAFNSFIPGSIPLTGPDVSVEQIEQYLSKAIMRVSDIGASYIVFGSGAARKVPEGFPVERAIEQLLDFLRLCERYAARYGVTIAIEPLNKGETNIINSVAEGLDLAMRADQPHVKLLVDLYHMLVEHEPFDIIPKAAKYLVHVHIANEQRRYPGYSAEDDEDFMPFFKALKESGYDGGISMECRFDDFMEDSARSLLYVKQMWQSV